MSMLFIESAVTKQFYIEVSIGNLAYESTDEYILAIQMENEQFLFEYYFFGFQGSKSIILTCDVNSYQTVSDCYDQISNGCTLLAKLYKNKAFVEEASIKHSFAFGELALTFSTHLSLKIQNATGLTPILRCESNDILELNQVIIPGNAVVADVSTIKCKNYGNNTLRESLNHSAIPLYNRTINLLWNKCELTDLSIFGFCDIYFLESDEIVHRAPLTSEGHSITAACALSACLLFIIAYTLVQQVLFVARDMRRGALFDRDTLFVDRPKSE